MTLRKQYNEPSYLANESRTLYESRKIRRHPVHWRVAIIRKTHGKTDIYHGRTHDISVSGASVHADQNIYLEDTVVMLLALPPQFPGLKEQLIEINCRMQYTVISDGRFRIGIQFLDFKGEGRALLSEYLSQRVIPEEKKQFRIE